MTTDLKGYYADRAAEYDLIYAKPERQKDLARLKQMLSDVFAGRDVLEIACGTGYWTPTLAEVAQSVVATDINEEVMEIARDRLKSHNNVRIAVADAYAPDVPGRFTAAAAFFWFSHVPKSRRLEFLSNLHARLRPGALVALIDNNYVRGSSSPMSDRNDVEGNTYSRRHLQDGREFDILKNFPTEEELRGLLEGIAADIQVRQLQYYWWLSYRLPEAAA